jgi:hypothetical protein
MYRASLTVRLFRSSQVRALNGSKGYRIVLVLRTCSSAVAAAGYLLASSFGSAGLEGWDGDLDGRRLRTAVDLEDFAGDP